MRSESLLLLVLVSLLLHASPVRAEGAGPGRGQTAEFVSLYQGNSSEAAVVERLRATTGGSTEDVMAMLFFVFKESIEQQNQDKRMWLTKLQMHNEIAEGLSDYLKELAEAARELDCASQRRSRCRDGIGTAENALGAFEARLGSSANLPADVRRDLYAMAQRDRQLFARARRLEQRARTTPPAPTPVPRTTQPLQPR